MKVTAALMFVLGVAITPREAVWAFVVDALLLAGVVGLSHLRVRFVLARLTVITPFILFALFIPFIGSGERIDVLGVRVSPDGLWSTWNIIAKASLGATVSIVLAGTTEVPAILRGLSRLHVPYVFTMIAAFMIRYLEVLAGELGRMRTAMTARGYDPRWLWQAKPMAAAAGSLFIRSYERGERVHAAMLSRGYTGVMPPALHDHRSTIGQWLAGLAPAVCAWAVGIIAWADML